ncbi:MAG TPA: class I SAM-dependent methyltransferase [Stellaceae bacterium]
MANRAWWEAAPMRYDWREDLGAAPGTEAYFGEIDRRFLSSAKSFLPWREIPFDTLIPFADLGGRDVLELGVGHGTHAQLLSSHCGSFTGIDLTAAAARMTARRLGQCGLRGRILQMDGEALGFSDDSFDYVWSWGVIHHSADTPRILAEISRVLRPGGLCTVMVYYRSWWQYHAFGLARGLLRGGWGSLHGIRAGNTDGAIARYYTPSEWRSVTRGLFEVTSIQVCGLKSDIVPLPHGALKDAVVKRLPDAAARVLTSRLRMGSLLIAQMRKPDRAR